MKLATLAVLSLLAVPAFAGGNTRHHKSADPTAAIAGAHSVAGAKAAAASLAAGGTGTSQASTTIEGSRALAIGSASPAMPNECALLAPQLFGAWTDVMRNHPCIVINLYHGYRELGAFDKAEAVLDKLADEEGVKFSK